MFESAELGHKVKKSLYRKEVPALREALLEAQFELAQTARFAVIILVGGLDGAGRGATVNMLNEWMDPRHIQTQGMGEPSDEELDRPMMWRFWRALPPKGKIGVFLGSWYTWPILNRVRGLTKAADMEQSLERAKQVLDAPVQGEAGETTQGPGEEPAHPLAGDGARLETVQGLRHVP
jgi:polyphosphate kinase 2 (PPK2 family)